VIVDAQSAHAGAGSDHRARLHRPRGQRPIEAAAIDDRRLGARGGVADREAGRRDEPDAAQAVQHRVLGQVELLEALRGDDAGAVHGIAYRFVLFADQHPMSVARETTGRVQASGAGPDDQHVDVQIGH
jgi:hypothetical protein